METSELENYGISELSYNEKMRTDGGINPFWVGVAGSLVANFLYQVVEDWEGNVESFKKGQTKYHHSGGAGGSY